MPAKDVTIKATYKAPKNITSVNAVIPTPKFGERIPFTAIFETFPENTVFFDLSYLTWTAYDNNSGLPIEDEASWKEQNMGDVFKLDHIYKVKIQARANDGYNFTENTKAKINGDDFDGVFYESYRTGIIEHTFEDLVEAPNTTHISLQIDAPIVGETPSFSPVVTSTPKNTAKLSYTYWYEYKGEADITSFDDTNPATDWLSMDSASIFKENKIYMTIVGFSGVDGCKIAENLKVTVNGKDLSEYIHVLDNRGSAGGIFVIFDKLKVIEIDSININAATPRSGELATGKVTIETSPQGGALNDTTTCNWCPPDDEPYRDFYRFDEKVNWTLIDLNVKIKPGYKITENTKWTVNGMSEKILVTKSKWGDYWVTYYFPVINESPVEGVDITVKPPVVGERSSKEAVITSAPNNSIRNDLYTVYWCEYVFDRYDMYNKNAWRVMDDTEVFEEGKYYSCSVVFETAFNYNIPYEASLTINGMPHDWVMEDKINSLVNLDSHHAYSSIVFNTIDNNPVENVEVEIAEPVPGKKPPLEATFTAKPDNSVTPMGSHETKLIWWIHDKETDTYSKMDPTSDNFIFEEGGSYFVDVILMASDNYYFAPTTKIIINGKDTEIPCKYIRPFGIACYVWENIKPKYSITVENGTARVNGVEGYKAHKGDSISIGSNGAPEGKEFDKWEITGINTSGMDLTKGVITFTMPAGNVNAKAIYKNHVHVYTTETITKAPSCTQEGEKTLTCSCGDTKTEKLAVTDHTPGEWEVVTEATIDAEGLKVKKCTVCSEELENQKIEKLHKHEYTETITKVPSCTEEGEKTLTCSCGDAKTEKLAETDHTPGEWEVIIAATVDTEGLKVKKCTICGTELEEVIPKLKPEEPTTKAEEPTTKAEEPTTKAEEPTTKAEEPTTKAEEPTTKAEEPTTKPDESTTKPDEPTTKPEEPTIKPEEPTTTPEEPTTTPEEPTTTPEEPVTDEHKHEYTTETITKVPSCTEEGEKTLTCLCGDTKTEKLTITDHTPGDWEEVIAATNKEEGLKIKKCAVCGVEIEKESIERKYLKGDIDNDGKITAADARKALRIAVQLETSESQEVPFAIIDVDGDTRITAADARKILRVAVQLDKMD